MTRTRVLFVQGAGEGAHAMDAALAVSLEQALSDAYDLHYPRMPDEADPRVNAWKRKIAAELARLEGKVVLVGHSVGGSILLNYLAEEPVKKPIAGLYLLAAPAWDEDEWNYDDLKLPPDLPDKLALIPRIVLYHSRDDAVVPFAHLALHRARIPQAAVRAMDSGGHQFGNDLSEVARDIQADLVA